MDHIDGRGCDLFARACDLDLEGIVAKRKASLCCPSEKPSPHWIKIKNPNYSQADGRQEFFAR
jgi:ATP-dependent DNA ligase